MSSRVFQRGGSHLDVVDGYGFAPHLYITEDSALLMSRSMEEYLYKHQFRVALGLVIKSEIIADLPSTLTLPFPKLDRNAENQRF